MKRARIRPRLLLGRVVVLLALAAAALASGPKPAASDSLPAAVIAVVDYQKILREAQAARSIREQVEARRRAYQEEIAEEEQRLHEADRELSRQRSVLSPEAFAERRREFEEEVGEVQRRVQERRSRLDEASTVALNEVRDAMIDVVAELAEDRGANVVLPSSTVLVFEQELDLTDEALERLDERLPDVRLPDRVN